MYQRSLRRQLAVVSLVGALAVTVVATSGSTASASQAGYACGAVAAFIHPNGGKAYCTTYGGYLRVRLICYIPWTTQSYVRDGPRVWSDPFAFPRGESIAGCDGGHTLSDYYPITG